MENVLYSKTIAWSNSEFMEKSEEAPTLYLTQESNGFAIWVHDGSHYLLEYFKLTEQNKAIESAVALGKQSLNELANNSLKAFPKHT